MLKLLFSAVIATAPMSVIPGMDLPDPDTELAVTCFKKGEVVDGMNKICFYNCLGSTAAITIRSVELCPLTIDN